MNTPDFRTIIAIESKPAELPIRQDALQDVLVFMAEAGNCIGLLKKILFTGKKADTDKLSVAASKMHIAANALSGIMFNVAPGDEIISDGYVQGGFTSADVNRRLLHAVMGSFDETGELAQALLLQGLTGELDTTNFKEELGDKRWYDEVAYDELDTTIGAIESLVYAKLLDKNRGRYKDGFSIAASENRDTVTERKLMEDHVAAAARV